MITSSGVPGRGFLYPGEYIVPKKVAEKMKQQELLDEINEGGVESNEEVSSPPASGEEGV